ncbi:hypothetical protein BDS110ZK12_36590 [Bradyrhizobium diazoefficiens]|nr:hypothetical protein H12S4_02950 [Bradyrhizobium diazoefficiens]BCE96274.1 hypothetical protein XF11B_02950 [Bradyrhizobium diazoefficiens]BCF04923.1 hypothetical protein XF12B_02960 [Bradyrhizobium diazoefficiens]BCF31219.1 hypothetical protein XF15B_02900 [Bradyrhizobium diazoefficiens]
MIFRSHEIFRESPKSGEDEPRRLGKRERAFAKLAIRFQKIAAVVASYNGTRAARQNGPWGRFAGRLAYCKEQR